MSDDAKVTLPPLYRPPDVESAHRLWGASCGPAALAAHVGCPLACVREFFPLFPEKAYVNFTMMKAAFDAIGVENESQRDYYVSFVRWPNHGEFGVLQVQIEGPWTDLHVPPNVALLHTHWIAVQGADRIYDVNADGWLTRAEWEGAIVPALLAAHRRSTGITPRRGFYFHHNNRGTRAAKPNPTQP